MPATLPALPFTTDWPGQLLKAIQSYLFWQYNDDQYLQAFVDAYNALAQGYVDWFNETVLADYRSLSGALLDWIGAGVYGIERPTLPEGTLYGAGALATWALATIAFATTVTEGQQTYYVVNDDIYQRVITWHFYKADGRAFTIRWLKRRIMRFLLGANGTAPNIALTPDLSVAIVGHAVTVNLSNSAAYPIAPLFQAAVGAKVLELPFQYTFTVNLL